MKLHFEFSDRTIYDIVHPCITTIFVCSYIAIHPDVPGQKDRWFHVLLRKLGIALLMLLVPELVIFWPLRQHMAAIVIARAYKNRGWTRAHGFLLAMGGFALYDGFTHEYIETLTLERFDELVESGEIEFPNITAERVGELGKADYFSKAVVVLQTTWFVTQCVARVVNKLALTEFEVITLALAILNAFMYGLWWDKPMDVGMPVQVYRRTGHGQYTPKSDKNARPMNAWSILGELTMIPTFTKLIGAYQPLEEDGRARSFITPSFDNLDTLNGQSLRRLSRGHQFKIMSVLTAVFILFGAIHFVPWFYPYPSQLQKWLWIAGSVSIVLFPIGALIVFYPMAGLMVRWKMVTDRYLLLYRIALTSTILSYFLSRVIVLVLPVVELFSRTEEGDYFIQTANIGTAIDWTGFLPHFG
ncbi:hypothetical protein CPB83DRAFT_904609 [Crepidotus variabilis]|uniref:Uncharacterized protein n=1 Tax=Crepidotus variabilis TaxID=179855 RepID=A0A9P6JS31_9AGAR|nr:hypothetical protein CPB83DRAFT_904609 [Crepidotus variabilis]